MPRKIIVVTTCFNAELVRDATIEKNLARAQELLATAKSLNPDLVCLPEVFLETNIPVRPATTNMSHVVLDMISRNARSLQAYIVAGGYEVIDSQLFNVAWVADRSGNIIGRYAKFHPTMGEIENWGIRPGVDIPVFDTDFGRLGIAICYDIGWPSLWKTLGNKGAELVVWPSAYDGGFPLQVYAWSNSYYVVSSVRTNHSKIIDKTGRVLASTSRWQGWVSHVIDLEKEILPIDDQYCKLRQLQQELGSRVTIESFSEERIFTLESNDPEWPIERIIKEYNIITLKDYQEKNKEIQDKAR